MDTPEKGPEHSAARALRAPIVTRTILIVTTASFLLQFVPHLDWIYRLGFIPALALEQPWRALTVVLVHEQPSPLHLFFNMVGVFFFGSFLERAIGHGRFLLLYVLGAIGGSTMVLLLADPASRDWVTLNIGASGAVFAIVGALLVPTTRLDRNLPGVIIFIALNFGYGFFVPGISWEAHLGGLITGFVLGAAALLIRGRRAYWIFGAVALGLVVLMLGGDITRVLTA